MSYLIRLPGLSFLCLIRYPATATYILPWNNEVLLYQMLLEGHFSDYIYFDSTRIITLAKKSHSDAELMWPLKPPGL